jgi:hypothetical protein
MTAYRLDVRNQGLIPHRSKRYFSSSVFRPALGPTKPPKAPGALSLGYSGWGRKLTTHLHSVPRLRMVKLYLQSVVCLHDVVIN